MREERNTRPSRQARERAYTKQEEFIMRGAIALVGIAAMYMALTFGLGHLFGVI